MLCLLVSNTGAYILHAYIIACISHTHYTHTYYIHITCIHITRIHITHIHNNIHITYIHIACVHITYMHNSMHITHILHAYIIAYILQYNTNICQCLDERTKHTLFKMTIYKMGFKRQGDFFFNWLRFLLLLFFCFVFRKVYYFYQL